MRKHDEVQAGGCSGGPYQELKGDSQLGWAVWVWRRGVRVRGTKTIDIPVRWHSSTSSLLLPALPSPSDLEHTLRSTCRRLGWTLVRRR